MAPPTHRTRATTRADGGIELMGIALLLLLLLAAFLP
jgi:hypothetical protein